MIDLETRSSAPSRLPGRLVLRVAPGLELTHIRSHRDVRTAHATPSTEVDRGGAIDRVLARYTHALRVSGAFNSRRNLDRPGARHLGWDNVEEELGLSRTFRIRIEADSDIGRAIDDDLDNLIDDLRALDEVEMVAPQFLCQALPAIPVRPGAAHQHPGDPRALIGADEALQMEPGDSALIVGLVDSGVALDHPELRGRLRPGLNSVSAVALSEGVTLLGGPRAHLQDVSDDQGHGTECAGIMCGNGLRIARGLAMASPLLPVRSLCGARVPDRDTPTAIGSLPDIDSGMKTAIDLGARVLNLSFGTPETALDRFDYVPHIDVVRYALERDCVLVVASGNGGDLVRYYPAALPGVIAVGAVAADRRPSGFTSRGAHVALSAPGERIPCCTIGGDGYTHVSGTSFAAPQVAAACALMLARAARQSTPLTAMAVRGLLADSASPFAPDADSSGCGAGILDVPAALRAVDEHCRAADDDSSIAVAATSSPASPGGASR
jgi:subtilisin family serine protease